MRTELDYYAILSVSPTVSPQDLKRQYRRLAKIYHPDRNPGEEEWCSEQMRRVNEAFDILSDPAKRARYDRELGTAQGEATMRDPGPKPRADQNASYSTWQTATPPPEPPRPAVAPLPPRRNRGRDTVLAGVAAALIVGAVAMVASSFVTRGTVVAPVAPTGATTPVHKAPAVRTVKRYAIHVRSVRVAHRRYAFVGTHRSARRHTEHRLTAAEKDAIAGALAEKIEMAKRAAAAKNNDL